MLQDIDIYGAHIGVNAFSQANVALKDSRIQSVHSFGLCSSQGSTIEVWQAVLSYSSVVCRWTE